MANRRVRLEDRHAIDSVGYLVCAVVYIALNPVKPGVCRHPADWPWCSYRETAGLSEPSGLLDCWRLYAILGRDEHEARATYVELVEDGLRRVRETRGDPWQAAAEVTAGSFGADALGGRATPG